MSDLRKVDSASPHECPNCNEEFNEGMRCPRILPCSHCFCTHCIDQIIERKPKLCPTCGRKFKAKTAEAVMVNQTAVGLLQLLAKKREAQMYPTTSSGQLVARKRSKAKEAIGLQRVNCQGIQKEIEENLQLIDFQKKITQETVDSRRNLIAKINSVLSTNTTKVTLCEVEATLLKQLKEVEDKSKQLETVQIKLDDSVNNDITETAVVTFEAEECSKVCGKWLKNFKEVISGEKKMLQKIEEELQKTNRNVNKILDVLRCMGDGAKMTATIPDTTAMAAHGRKFPEHITLDILQEKSDLLKHLAEQGKIFAVLQNNVGKRKCARISITEDKLILHHLRNDELPPEVYIIQHQDVMRLAGSSSRLTFLELKVDGIRLGRLYISLAPNTNRAAKFWSLCTGEMGPSFTRNFICRVQGKDCATETVRFGENTKNYVCNIDSKNSFVSGDQEEGTREYIRPWTAGIVGGNRDWGIDSSKDFHIFTRDRTDFKAFGSFGQVEKGLSVLSDAIRHNSKGRNVFVSDCGIVLP